MSVDLALALALALDPSQQWPGSGFSFYVHTSGYGDVIVNMYVTGCTDNCHYFLDVEAVNLTPKGESPSQRKKVEVYPGVETFSIQFEAERMAYGWSPWLIKATKLTEGTYDDAQGLLSIYSVTVEGGELQQGFLPSPHSVLFIGDSITTAYGVDGYSGCSFEAAYQNIQHSYAWLSAVAVGAKVSLSSKFYYIFITPTPYV